MSGLTAVKLVVALVPSGVGGVLAAGSAASVVTMVDNAMQAAVQAFQDLPTELKRQQLSEKSVLLTSDGSTELAEFRAESRAVVPLTAVNAARQARAPGVFCANSGRRSWLSPWNGR